MRQNLNNGERMLSIIGGLAFAGLGLSQRWRGNAMGKATACLGITTVLAGIIGYDPLVDLMEM